MIPFNLPFLVGTELDYVREAHAYGQLAGDGAFTKRCHRWLEAQTGCCKALLVHSCTGALEMAAILAGIQTGDEVILPSYTFVSTANAFVLRGGVPVFVDVDPRTLNLDPAKAAEAITPRTRAIVPVHYAGVACDMDAILEIADQHGLLVIEDAAQGAMSTYRGKALGAIGHFGAYSYHETKNIHSGEGGALLINDPRFVDRAEVIREKGTDRSRFFRGEVDKYTWVDVGSSYLPGELVAAFLWGQLEAAGAITEKRLHIWHRYHSAFEHLEATGRIRRPVVPDGCVHNAHMYYILLSDRQDRANFIAAMKAEGVHCVFHYVPLHSSPFGGVVGRVSGNLDVTEDIADRLVRLPMWIGLDVDRVIEAVERVLFRSTPRKCPNSTACNQ